LGIGDSPQPESYVLSLLAEGKHRAAFDVIPEFGSPEVYAPHLANSASRLWRAGRTTEAIDVLNTAIQLDPALPAPRITLGMIDLSQGRLDAGQHHLQQAVSLDPRAATAHYLLGVVAKNSSRITDALSHFISCLNARPAHPDAPHELRSLLRSPACHGRLRAQAEAALSRADRAAAAHGRPTLSICIIARDEESSLPRCLASIRPVADQIVLVDTGSADTTPQIAREFGAEVHSFHWCDDFAAARNAAIERAHCSWILIVDADEEFPPGSCDQLRDLLAGPIPASVCQLTTHAPDRPGASAADLVAHTRLFRSGEGIHFRGAVHEQLVDQNDQPIHQAVFTGIPVLHHGYLEPSAAIEERAQRNLRLLAKRASHEPDNPAVLFYLGAAQLAITHVEQAIASLQRTLDLSQPDRSFRPKAVVLLADALTRLERWPDAQHVLQDALAAQPDHPQLLCAWGHELERQNRTEEALDAYRAATRGRFGPMLDYQDFTCRDLKPRTRLAVIHLLRGQAGAAADQIYAVLAIRPEAAEARHLLVSALLAATRHAEARVQLDAILAQHPDDAHAHNNLGVLLAHAGSHQQAAREFDTAVALRPDDPDMLCNLARSQHEQRCFERARDAWEKVLKRDPSHITAWLGLAKTYLESGAYQAGVKCYQMAARHSGHSPEVMEEIEQARAALVSVKHTDPREGDPL